MAVCCFFGVVQYGFVSQVFVYCMQRVGVQINEWIELEQYVQYFSNQNVEVVLVVYVGLFMLDDFCSIGFGVGECLVLEQ